MKRNDWQSTMDDMQHLYGVDPAGPDQTEDILGSESLLKAVSRRAPLFRVGAILTDDRARWDDDNQASVCVSLTPIGRPTKHFLARGCHVWNWQLAATGAGQNRGRDLHGGNLMRIMAAVWLLCVGLLLAGCSVSDPNDPGPGSWEPSFEIPALPQGVDVQDITAHASGKSLTLNRGTDLLLAVEFLTEVDNILDVRDGFVLLRLYDDSGFPDGRLHLLDFVEGKAYVLASDRRFFDGRISPDAATVASIEWGTFQVWRFPTPWSNTSQQSEDIFALPHSIAWSPSGALVCAVGLEDSGDEPRVIMLDADSSKALVQLELANDVTEVLGDEAIADASTPFSALCLHLDRLNERRIVQEAHKNLPFGLKLPFAAGESWLVTQAYNTTYTHRAGTPDAWALDFTMSGCQAWRRQILACESGTISYANGNRQNTCGSGGYGLFCSIDHGGGYVSMAGHLDGVDVSVGQRVSQGALLGRCGNSGWACGTACAEHPGTHLHFRLTRNGSPVAPEPMSGFTNFVSGRWYTSDNNAASSQPWPPNDGFLKVAGSNAVNLYMHGKLWEITNSRYFFGLLECSTSGTWPQLPEYTEAELATLPRGPFICRPGLCVKVPGGRGTHPASAVWVLDGDEDLPWTAWRWRVFQGREAMRAWFWENYGEDLVTADQRILNYRNTGCLIDLIGEGEPIEPPASIPPTASFTATPTSGTAPLQVSFTDTSSAGSAAITSWRWDFGDGAASAERNPSHLYVTPGLYTVSLTVSTSCGEDTATRPGLVNVTALSIPPTASFTATPTSGNAPLQASFTDTSSAGSAAITSWRWDFGDGATSAEQNPSHLYVTPGLYTASLTVSTSCGENILVEPGLISVEDSNGEDDDELDIWPTLRFQHVGGGLAAEISRGIFPWRALFLNVPSDADIVAVGIRHWHAAGPPWEYDEYEDFDGAATIPAEIGLDVQNYQPPWFRGAVVAWDRAGTLYWSNITVFESRATLNDIPITPLEGCWEFLLDL